MLDPRKVVSAHFERSGTPEVMRAHRSDQCVNTFGVDGWGGVDPNSSVFHLRDLLSPPLLCAGTDLKRRINEINSF